MLKIVRKIRRAITGDEPGYHDMVLNRGERFFARLYLHHIREVLAAHQHPIVLSLSKDEGERPRPLKLLDAGCQTGRLAIPLAKDGHRVTGLDTSGMAVRKARNHAREAGVTLELVRADLGAWLPKQPAGSFDAVLCNEVLYLRENWRELLRGLIRLLRPGGLCFISHRPPAFYLKEATGEGKVEGSYYNWQKRDELERIYRENGIQVLKILPVWRLSRTVNPEMVTEEQRDRLFQEEISSPDDHADGRYLLVCGKKR
jgi:SAM-dependent methyltransferase